MYVLPSWLLAKLSRYEEEQKKAAEIHKKAKEDKSKQETSASIS